MKIEYRGRLYENPGVILRLAASSGQLPNREDVRACEMAAAQMMEDAKNLLDAIKQRHKMHPENLPKRHD